MIFIDSFLKKSKIYTSFKHQNTAYRNYKNSNKFSNVSDNVGLTDAINLQKVKITHCLTSKLILRFDAVCYEDIDYVDI